jgi:hypothetical protein
MQRCDWATTEPLLAYHDNEWGVPVHDERTLFEFLMLEGAQAGLSWEIILKKRTQYRLAFDHFDARAIASYGERKIEHLLANPASCGTDARLLPRLRTHTPFSRCNRSSEALMRTSGSSSGADPSRIVGNACRRFLHVPQNPTY